ncbi:hypothetical protein PANT_15c00044 [Moesziomyces antarcticus T-34]|uniref:Uncharacterized protein n=1 Tax=Pseudozyma antarctica (strain T-34) TaxID=1151754 RepID=M9MGN8_PSEA3|nr:hypothetical protein PANT_15c00044 [Moesziomyces antarcticus T-34]
MQELAAHPHPESSADSPVWRLGTGKLDEWLKAHLPSHLSASSAPILVTCADPTLRVAESLTDEQTAADDTFINAKQLMNEAIANVDQIQKDDAIPVRINSRSTKSSKKQCRDHVQNLFHDQIMLMATDHPLWSQGRWTLILNPQHLDATWTRLVKSFEAVPRRAHLGGQKRKKAASSRSSNSRTTASSSSPRTDNERSVAIDVFFRAVWSSEVARNVLQSVAEACGKMPIFCRASLYSLLGIRSGHPLGNRSTLYNSKAFASPAEFNLWTSKHERSEGDASTAGMSAAAPSSAAGDNDSVAEAPAHVPSEPSAHLPSEASIAETAATDPEIHAEAAPEERPPKKVRIDSQPTQVPNKAVEEPTATAVEQAQHATQETASTQDELMLPVRPAVAPVTHKAVEPSADQNEKHDLGTAREKEPKPAAADQYKPESIVTEQELGAAEQEDPHSGIAADGKPSDDAAKEVPELSVDQHAKQEPSAEAVRPGTVSDQEIGSTTQDEPKIQIESQTQDESMTQIEPIIAHGQDSAGAEAQPEKPLQRDSVTVAPSSAAVEAAAAEMSTLAESHTEPPAPQQEKKVEPSEAEQRSADSAAASVKPEKDVQASEAEQPSAGSATASTQQQKDVEPSKAEQHPAESAVASTEQLSPASVAKASDGSTMVVDYESRRETKETLTGTLELPMVASVDQKAVPAAKDEDAADTSTTEVEKGSDAAASASVGEEATAPKQVSEGEANPDTAAAQEATTTDAAKSDDAPAKADESKVAGAEMALEDLIVEAAVAVELAPPAAEAGADQRDNGPAPA